MKNTLKQIIIPGMCGRENIKPNKIQPERRNFNRKAEDIRSFFQEKTCPGPMRIYPATLFRPFLNGSSPKNQKKTGKTMLKKQKQRCTLLS